MLVGLTVYLGAAALLERAGQRRPDPRARFDAIVVLGCPVRPDGEASDALKRRVLLAAELHAAGHAPRVVLTGAATCAGLPTEAEAAARVLSKAGVPRSAMILEEQSLTTRENARCTARLGHDLARVLVVTDAFHLPRALLLFRPHFGNVEGAGVMGSITARARGALREVPLLAVYGALSFFARGLLARAQ